MNHFLHEHFIHFVLLFILTSLFTEIPAGTSSDGNDYSHRQRKCEIKIVTPDSVPLPGLLVGIAQLHNRFTFGGMIHGEAFDSLGDSYRENFLNYFDAGIPAHEMMWDYVMKGAQKGDPDFSKADVLVDWLLSKNIIVHGHSLFSNEKDDRIPEWTRSLDTAAFKQAMQERIDTTMAHFKGNVPLWDLFSEICHGANDSLLSGGVLQAKSGNPNIFSWIMDEARKKDSVANFIINDYGLITSSDQTAADKYIEIVKPLSGKFDIIGAMSHFNESSDKSTYEPKINYLAQQLGKPVWVTNVDFSGDIDKAPDKIEELMRTCFANPKVEGLTMGGWDQRFMPGSDLVSYFVDSLNNETPTGQRWREVREEWKTIDGGNTNDSGIFTFTGFLGQYHVLISCDFDTFYLEPGEGTQKVEVVYQHESAVNHVAAGLKTIEFSVNGISACIKLPARYDNQLYLTTYSLSGQQLSRSLIHPTSGKHRVTPAAASYCRVFRIETVDRLPLYTGKIMAVH